MFVAALSIIVPTSKLPKWPSPTKWKNKLWNPHPTDYYTSVKVNMLHTAVPMNTECRAKAVHRKWAHAIWFHLYKGKNGTSWANLRDERFPLWRGGSDWEGAQWGGGVLASGYRAMLILWIVFKLFTWFVYFSLSIFYFSKKFKYEEKIIRK